MHFIITKEDYGYLRYDAVDRLNDAKLTDLAELFTQDRFFVGFVRAITSTVVNQGFFNGSYVNLSDVIDKLIVPLGLTDPGHVNTVSWVFNEIFVSVKSMLQGVYVDGNLYSVESIRDRFSSEVIGLDVKLVLPLETSHLYTDIIPIRQLVEAVLPGDI